MKKKKIALGLLIAFISLCYACSDKNVSAPDLREPIETIVHKGQEEDEGNALRRDKWIESMHRTAPGQNWRDIERSNSIKKQKDLARYRSNGIVVLGDSLYTGIWEEKGSNNQAGSVIAVNYLPEENSIYTISAGGTLWKGNLDGNDWQVVNESFVFDSKSLEFIDLPNGQKRMIIPIARIPHYSDDMGLTWKAATGITSSGDFWSQTSHFETIILPDGNQRIYCLSKFDFFSSIKMLYSDDLGESYTELEDLGTTSFDRVAVCKPHHSNEIIIGQATFNNRVTISKVNIATNTIDFDKITNLSLDSDADRVYLIGSYLNQDSTLYSVQSPNQLMRSKDGGSTWDLVSTFQDNPWEVGFYVSPSNSNQVFYGEVEAHRLSENEFVSTNIWWEYYSDIENKIHADIMSYNEFEDQNGDPFLLIANHGGLSISRDYLQTTKNISLAGLNVSQYYDVRTDPNNPNFVYVGTQDQGFQRSRDMTTPGVIDFDQVISGDYGHLTFTNNGRGLWMTFPGGSIDFYNDPQNGSKVDDFIIDSFTEGPWLPPMATVPGSTRNEILVAGGDITGGFGSHIIKLEYFGGISAEQFPFDFNSNFDANVVSSIEVSTINPNIIYAATNNGLFYTSRDGGQTFAAGFNSINDGHFLYGASTYASTINENEVWIAGSGYNEDGVFYSDDYGQNFTLFSEGLPPTLVFEITANTDETQFYAATEAGPYVYLTETQRWEDLSQGNSPTHTYWSVEYIESLDLVRFGTYGRGIWDFKFQQAPVVSILPTSLPLHTFARLYPNPVKDFLTIETLVNIVSADSDLQVEIYNTTGQRMISHKMRQGNERIDFSQLASGNYIIQINDGKKMQVEKVIRQ